MTQGEAAIFHEVSIDTVKSWCSGRRKAPKWAIDAMKAYVDGTQRPGMDREDR